jgi:hypothetical protein
MSFGSRAATDLCTLTPHCSQSERTRKKPCPAAASSALAMTVLTSDSLTVARLSPTGRHSSPSLFMPEAPLERLERPPRHHG